MYIYFVDAHYHSLSISLSQHYALDGPIMASLVAATAAKAGAAGQSSQAFFAVVTFFFNRFFLLLSFFSASSAARAVAANPTPVWSIDNQRCLVAADVSLVCMFSSNRA